MSTKKLFYTVLILHILIWSISPVLIRYTVSADAIESFVWGQYLAWGYDKNPYLAGWIPHFALWLNIGNSAVGYYLVQQLMIGLGFWSVWKLGNLLFDPYRALVAVLMYEGCLYFSVYAQTNNDNFPLVALWGIAALTFYLACHTQQWKYWLMTGFILGLAMMAKYSTLIFMASLFLYMLIEKEARQSFRRLGLYVGAVGFLIPILPNIVWLFQHDFTALRYMFARTALEKGDNTLIGHLSYVAEFIGQTAVNFVGCLVLFALTLPTFIAKAARNQTTAYYVWCVGVFPTALVLVLAVLLGWQLYWEWGVPFVIFWGLVLVHYFQPKTHAAAVKHFVIGVLFAIVISLWGNILVSCYLQAGKGTADYPAQAMAERVTQVWKSHYATPLRFIVGNRYTAGYIGFYAGDKPQIFVEGDETSNLTLAAEIRKQGAIFVQDNAYGSRDTQQFLAKILQKYPQMIVLPAEEFPYHRNEKSGEVAKLLIGILPPAPQGGHVANAALTTYVIDQFKLSA